MQRGSVTTLCCLTPLTGFLIICLGAFFFSMGSGSNCRGKLILAYCFLPLGFLILLSGIFWSTYQQASQSKHIFNRVLRQHLGHEDLQIPAVDRPDFYPPSYEDSIDPEKQIPLQQKTFNIPPPLYTESSLEFMDDTDSHRDIPPSYEVSVSGMLMAEVAGAVVTGGGGGGEAVEGQGQECLPGTYDACVPRVSC
ncbi:transmembrane protein 252 [Phascolarctos cinereus]|uniref:Transmembrane protein 252 n=1 Tax=Phascolarctos cinereus TaxID=38626 RepID=A0A6P5LI87_PHACI|nr:transmembrane protein 252 [Phascolarctos cinereus]